MSIYYSAATQGFYDARIHGKRIPEDGVEITREQHQALLKGQSRGTRITARADGHPVLAERPAPPVEEQAEQARRKRDRLLATEIDTLNPLRISDMTGAEFEAWQTYRQALLEVPQQPGFPQSIDWPVKPD
ncbi:phage tail assembly chaperone [Marinobacterium sedimentorum]|uniref:phage tail assembly chaperone n=1 Tax=Marinobacterium sedimentorum TaxID=2927804 RepID=UPI0020C69B4D|nr:phage tail assembly chaperone [Marinobacterium sedimentorum]MCP8687745.1 phage tail assembly chaperone [Marinobacterium sedimentorum]